jgi:hypothetical protein
VANIIFRAPFLVVCSLLDVRNWSTSLHLDATSLSKTNASIDPLTARRHRSHRIATCERCQGYLGVSEVAQTESQYFHKLLSNDFELR